MMMRRSAPGVIGGALILVLTSACNSGSDSADSKTQDHSTTHVAWSFVGRPDLTPPRIAVDTGDDQTTTSDGGELVLLAEKDERLGAPMNGPLIVRPDGTPVWVHPMGTTRWAYDLRVQTYRNKPVLTYWTGDTSHQGYGFGEIHLLNQHYREIATVTTPGTHADIHDGTLTPRGTALLISYPEVRADLSALGGPADGWIRNSVVSEVDVKTGRVVFRWSMAAHVPLSDTEQELDPKSDENGTQNAPFDPYHVNSVKEDGDDALLVSSRNAQAVYRVLRPSGTIDWTLGGTSSDFTMGAGAAFHWQHDVERQDDGTITMFDNEAAPAVGKESRGLRLDVDTDAHTATVVAQYLPPDGRLSESQGNVDVQDDGTVFVGWGSNPFFSHYTADGTLLSDAKLPGGISYRAYLQPWVGRPSEPPRFLLHDGTAYASWNGATEVASWRFVAGPDQASATTVATVPADAFEVSTTMPDAAYIAAEALDADGTVLGVGEPGAWP